MQFVIWWECWGIYHGSTISCFVLNHHLPEKYPILVILCACLRILLRFLMERFSFQGRSSVHQRIYAKLAWQSGTSEWYGSIIFSEMNWISFDKFAESLNISEVRSKRYIVQNPDCTYYSIQCNFPVRQHLEGHWWFANIIILPKVKTRSYQQNEPHSLKVSCSWIVFRLLLSFIMKSMIMRTDKLGL